MTPDEIALIGADSEAVIASADEFSKNFYASLFEIAPQTRALFPEDIGEQRGKLMAELESMIGAALAYGDPDRLDAFVRRTRNLGRRHVKYGVHAEMYEPVAIALLAALRDCVVGFDDVHATAWTKLYTLVSQTMLEGAEPAT